MFPSLKSKANLVGAAPVRLDQEKKEEWAEKQYKSDLSACYDAISARLVPVSSLSAGFTGGELSISANGITIIDRIFVDKTEGEFILAQWKVLVGTFTITEKTDGKKVSNALRKLVVADNPALVQQIIALEGELSKLEADIARQEGEMNGLINRLYGLSPAEEQLVTKG